MQKNIVNSIQQVFKSKEKRKISPEHNTQFQQAQQLVAAAQGEDKWLLLRNFDTSHAFLVKSKHLSLSLEKKKTFC